MAGRVAKNCAVVAEKPSVARDIARALGARRRGGGFFSGNGLIVTWAVGHLARIAEPHEINPSWKVWSREALPMLPSEWPLVVDEERADQFGVIKKILTSPKVGRVVSATDAGREGELIFRQIYDLSASSKPVDRLWISSLTPAAIRAGFERLRPASDFDGLADAARARSRADWLVGLNLTRFYTIGSRRGSDSGVLSVGRVQTPTLAMLVDREIAIRDFVPEDYLEVRADFEASEGRRYRGVYFKIEKGKRQHRLAADGKEAEQIVKRAKSGRADIESVKRSLRRVPPPLLYDLTELQRDANRLYGFSAERTLSLAQALYEKRKAITYPRTDSRHLSTEVAGQLGRIAQTAMARYDSALIAEGTGDRPLGKRFVDDKKVTDHHAIIPTGSGGSPPKGSPEAKLLDLVQRRLLQAWHRPYRYSSTTVVTRVVQRSHADRYLSQGTSVEDPGWKVLEVKAKSKRSAKPKKKLPGGLKRGERVQVLGAKAVKKTTKPPKRFTDATLLTAMESAGKALDDRALSDAMRERGIGTPATRAQIIETLLKRSYIERVKNALRATPHGIRLVEHVHPKVRSPEMTGEWEAKLRGIERGNGEFEPFMRGIEDFVRDVVGSSVQSPPGSLSAPPVAAVEPAGDAPPHPADGDAPHLSVAQSVAGPPPSGPPPSGPPPGGQPERGPANGRPRISGGILPGRQVAPDRAAQPARSSVPAKVNVSKAEMRALLRDRFGHPSFRPNQESICREVISGRDVLLVMPTGAGKSLCYQLPGIARGKTTIVISPLIALMEDQTSKLRALGIRAERIHSGLDRMNSRRVCVEYKRGELDFLFIAPERFSVPGFPELLSKFKPGLVAIDEAHCISMWGHDFRPDYRRLRERVPMLRPAPVIALTATATKRVQGDIIEQLGLDSCKRSIHGFRRDNLEIEHVELVPSLRLPALGRLMLSKERRPAIVYAPTRAAAEEQAALLREAMPAEAYHAGMPADDRDRVQSAFLGGDLEVVVATIAFGMGIDKADVRTVVHTAMPGSVEGYYQEIGRAGRDGLPSKAILMWSWADRKTHEFFLNRDYPEPGLLDQLYSSLSQRPVPLSEVIDSFPEERDKSERVAEKLWMHGGLTVTPDETAVRGEQAWRESYEQQRDFKLRQIELMTDLTRSRECRMLDLVRHFDDLEDSLQPCGHCDNCDSGICQVNRFRKPTRAETSTLAEIRRALLERDAQSTGKLYRDQIESTGLKRRDYERLLSALARAGMVEIVPDEFYTAKGRLIKFARVALTPSGRSARSFAGQVTLPQEQAGLKKPSKSKRAAKPARGKARGRPKQLELGSSDDGGRATALIASALRAWRKDEARRTGKPAFTILRDRSLEELSLLQPSNEAELLKIYGIGPAIAKRFGQQILRVIRASKP